MTDHSYFPVPKSVAKSAHVDNDAYLEMYKQSIEDPEGFWGSTANGSIGRSHTPR